MTGRLVKGLAVVALATFSGGSAAAEDHGIAMHGTPKYQADFSHFDYINPRAPKGGTLRLAAVGSFDSLNPYILKGVPAQGLQWTFESLLNRAQDEPFSLYGRLARRVVAAADRGHVTFHLDPRARFADGRPVTVQDVLFSYNTLRAEGRANHRLYYKRVAAVEPVGDDGIRFRFADTSDREQALIMGLMPILPRHWFADRPFNVTTLTAIPGSGPYEIVDVEPGRQIEYRRREDFWGRDLGINVGHYNFDRVHIDYYRDAVVATQAFFAGAYDLRLEFDPTRWVAQHDNPVVRRGDVRLFEAVHGRPSGMRGFVFNIRRSRFQDRRVRQALALVLDFDGINHRYFGGALKRTDSYFANSELAAKGAISAAERQLLTPFAEDLPQAIFDQAGGDTETAGSARARLKQAFSLLKSAGWQVKDRKLVQVQSGEIMNFEILLADPREERVALDYSRSLRRLGVMARVRVVDSAQFQRRLREFDFDMVQTYWYQSLSPGAEQAYYWGSAAANDAGSRNYAGLKSAAVDHVLEQLTAARERNDLVVAARTLDRLLLQAHLVVPLYYAPYDRFALWDRFGMPENPPLYGRDFMRWWRK